jgi:MoaA/NifB/PqqE/SkfB family radical SAM enzyme
MDFPQFISFTVTNSCNLRCRMCGQWSEEGYISNRAIDVRSKMDIEDWKRLVDEVAQHKIRFVLVRGGEPFLFKGIIELLQYINSKGLSLSVDTNGTIIGPFADDLARIGNMHITFSVDGPEEVHDQVRGVKGSFKKTKDNVALLNELEKKTGNKISKSICFTISKYNYKHLGEMPEVARSMSIQSISIVPYYYFPDHIGKQYEAELKENFNCAPFSWKGFHHDSSGIDFEIFREEHQRYLANLDGIENFPYMPLSEDEYRTWFGDAITPVRSSSCMNIENLIDIQPNGEANFCVDFPDYSIGNVKSFSIEEIWNGNRALRFRNYRREKPLSICYRCGPKFISEIKE